MLEKIVKSPISSALILISLGYLLLQQTAKEQLPVTIVQMGIWPALIFPLLWVVLLIIHNLRAPNKKAKANHFFPPELREEDEGHQWITYKACRKVYIFYYFALPGAILAITIIQSIPYFPLLVLVLLGVGQHLIYWSEIRKLH